MEFPEIEKGAAYFERNGTMVKLLTYHRTFLALLNMRHCTGIVVNESFERPRPVTLEILMLGTTIPIVISPDRYFEYWALSHYTKKPYDAKEILDQLRKMLQDAMAAAAAVQ
jgi:hypothetical protein